MSLFICPICSKNVEKKGNVYQCKNNHSFDISSKGYVNLLPSNQKNSFSPGDDKSMVSARNNFLSKGYYLHLKEELCILSSEYSNENVTVLDCGCGEGYYTKGIYSSLIKQGKNVDIAGIDISKYAVRLAAKNHDKGEFAVASSFHLPIKNDSIDILINCFSPLCENEFLRVLKKGAAFIYVVPAPKHLWQLKCELYENPYENEIKTLDYKGFTLKKTARTQKEIFLEEQDDIQNLFKMTPYVWKTQKTAKEKLLNKQSLVVNTEFIIYVYIKN